MIIVWNANSTATPAPISIAVWDIGAAMFEEAAGSSGRHPRIKYVRPIRGRCSVRNPGSRVNSDR